MKMSPKPITAEPKETSWRRGRPPGEAALRTALGSCRRLEPTSQASIAAIAYIPSFSQRPGATQASSQPRLTQAGAESAGAAVGPLREPRAAQASANSGIASKASGGLPPRTIAASASAANGGTATRAREGREGATADSSAIAATTTTIESGSTRAQVR